MSTKLNINLMKTVILCNFSLLLFVLSIPGTIALRNTLAVLLIIVLALSWLKNKILMKPLFNNKSFRSIILILLILSIYILIHSFFLADELYWSLSQYRTQWIYPMIYFTIGIFLASHAFFDKVFKKETLINVIFFSLFLHVLYLDLVAIYQYIETGQLLTRYGGITGSPVLANYITNILIAFIIVELISRFKTSKITIQINTLWLLLILILCIFSSIVENMRFGVISLFIMSIAGVIFFISGNKKLNTKVKALLSLLLLILCALPLIYNAKSDSRWATLIETIPIAIAIDSSNYWIGNENRNISEIPLLANGEAVSHSNYARIAWLVKGVEYISKDIFGIGYGKNIFGHAVEKYEGIEMVRGMHSHSSIIDFTIGVGLIGLLIWLIFIGKLIISQARVYFNTDNYYALLSIFFTTGFFIRSLVDSNMRDHMFKQFFLIIGISLALSFHEHIKSKKNS